MDTHLLSLVSPTALKSLCEVDGCDQGLRQKLRIKQDQYLWGVVSQLPLWRILSRVNKYRECVTIVHASTFYPKSITKVLEKAIYAC